MAALNAGAVRIQLPNIFMCHQLLQETRHVSSPFITTGPNTDFNSLGDIKLLLGLYRSFAVTVGQTAVRKIRLDKMYEVK